MKLRTLIVLVLMIYSIALFSQEIDFSEGQSMPNTVNSLFPLKTGITWTYQIYKAGQPVGTLEATVTKATEIDTRWNWKIPVYTVQLKDSFKNKTWEIEILNSFDDYYIKRNGTYYPFMRDRLTCGDQLGDMLAIAVDFERFNNSTLLVVTLQHISSDIQEKYLQNTGLFYYRNDDLEYKLVKANVIEQR